MGRLPRFSESEREFHERLLKLDPSILDANLDFIADAVVTDLTFEPYADPRVGNMQGLFEAAVNLFHFVEEYERRTGSLELPPER